MKKVLLVLSVGTVFATMARADDPVPNPLVAISVKNVFVPAGFDDNDEAQVVVDGYLPNTCYRVSHSTTEIDQATGEIHVTQYARKFNGMCLDMVVPFFSETRIGVLPAGQYKLKTLGVADENMAISESTNGGPDDYLYAPVDTATVRYDDAQGVYIASIQGRFTSSCMEWDDVKTLDQGKVLVLLPVLKPITDDGVCQAAETPFTKEIVLPANMAAGRHLLHARSLNGKAVNYVFQVQ